MSTSNFNLRGIPSEVMSLLKKEAERLHTSANLLIIRMIERGLGLTHSKPIYHDLDHLAGSWSTTEENNFKEHIRSFEQIDKDLWS